MATSDLKKKKGIKIIDEKVNELLILLSRQTKFTEQYTDSDVAFLKDIASLLNQCNGMLYYLERHANNSPKENPIVTKELQPEKE